MARGWSPSLSFNSSTGECPREDDDGDGDNDVIVAVVVVVVDVDVDVDLGVAGDDAEAEVEVELDVDVAVDEGVDLSVGGDKGAVDADGGAVRLGGCGGTFRCCSYLKLG